MIPRATSSLYRANAARVLALLGLVRREWWQIGDDLEAGWLQHGPRITSLTSAAMIGAATDGAVMVPAALAQTGFRVSPLMAIDPVAFGSLANLAPYGDRSGLGVPLGRHLHGAVIRARSADVGSLDERLLAGQHVLDRLVHTQVVEAARGAAQAAITATPHVGWVRLVNPPCCQDCAVQAGRWFRYNQGFERHPNCDCIHRPAHEDEAPEGFTQDVPTEQIHDLTVGQRLALEDGGDLSQVVNAYRRAPLDDRGRKQRDRMGDYTAEGTTRSGWHAYVQRTMARQRGETLEWVAGPAAQRGYVRSYRVRRLSGPRPTPDAIYRFSADRAEAIRLLAANGYVVGDLQRVAAMALGA